MCMTTWRIKKLLIIRYSAGLECNKEHRLVLIWNVEMQTICDLNVLMIAHLLLSVSLD